MPRLLGRTRIRSRLFSAILFILCSTLPVYTQASQSASKPPTWKSNEALLNQLDSAQTVEEFLINPPKGYTSQTQSGPHGSKVSVWAGSPRPDGTRPQVMILTVTLPPEELRGYRLEEILDELVARVGQHRKDWKRTPTEQGLINGLLFVRTRWNGTDISTGYKMHGFSYVAIAGEKVIQLSSQDVEPYHKEALELAESSAFTFKAR